jgi:secretion/DNA translocation related TadE-like protein
MRRPDRGSAGLLAVWAAALVLTVGTAAMVWGTAVAARHRAARTADLAALAAADILVNGGGDPCAAARRVAVATTPTAGVPTCSVLGDSVLVVVELPLSGSNAGGGLLARLVADMPPARGRARAGVQQ